MKTKTNPFFLMLSLQFGRMSHSNIRIFIDNFVWISLILAKAREKQEIMLSILGMSNGRTVIFIGCVKIKSEEYFVVCYRNLVTIISLLYSSEYRVRNFFCFSKLVDVLIPPIYSFSYDTGETEVCPHDFREEAPEVHPRPDVPV